MHGFYRLVSGALAQHTAQNEKFTKPPAKQSNIVIRFRIVSQKENVFVFAFFFALEIDSVNP